MTQIYSELENEHEYSLTKEEAFDRKVKVVLWHMDEYHASGMHREGAEIIRELMAQNAQLKREYQKLESDCEARIQAALGCVESEVKQ